MLDFFSKIICLDLELLLFWWTELPMIRLQVLHLNKVIDEEGGDAFEFIKLYLCDVRYYLLKIVP